MVQYRKPEKFFEDAGIVDPNCAYHVYLEHVVNSMGHDMKTMVDMGRYFSIFAPRQSGKTTFFRDFCFRLAKDLTYVPVLLSFQDYRNIAGDQFYSLIHESLEEQLVSRLSHVHCPQLHQVKTYIQEHSVVDHISFRKLFEELNKLIEEKKIIIFIDEFDGIPPSELENFLTTLRELYQKYKGRKDKALYSVGLVGIRNITKLIVGGVSPFNIADQVRLPPFSHKNVKDLYAQHTRDTNQPFTAGAIQRVYEETGGQPWLVNRLGTILTVDIKPHTTDPISEEDVEAAIERLLLEKNSHFDNLLEKAKRHKETFVEIVFDGVAYNPDDEDQSWLEQYGLIKEQNKKAQPANPIYCQRFLRAFFKASDAATDTAYTGYYRSDGLLDMEAIFADFTEYIIQVGVNAFYAGKKPYEKTGQFLLTAWLYPFVETGRGELRYEVPTGLGRMDILLTWRGRKYILETKVNRANREKTIERAVAQLCEKYLLTEKADEGFAVVFDVTTRVGELQPPEKRKVDDMTVMVFVIGIGR